MRTKTGKAIVALSIILSLALGTSFISLGLAKEEKEKEDTRPERGITMAFEYPEVIIGKGDDVSVDLIVKNKGKRDENVYFTISSAPLDGMPRSGPTVFLLPLSMYLGERIRPLPFLPSQKRIPNQEPMTLGWM